MAKLIKKFDRRKIKIATLYISRPIDRFSAETMDTIRWLKISEALAHLGYQVDMITNERNQKIVKMGKNLRRVPYREFNWKNYHVIKTLFQEGFASLQKAGGQNHPFIIAKTTVVGKKNLPSVHFSGWTRWRLYNIQKKMHKKAKYITVLTEQNRQLWIKEFGPRKILLVPTGTELEIPSKKTNPYKFKEKIALFSGNIRNKQQRGVNRRWQKMLNDIGARLKPKNIRLCFLGSGDADRLNPDYVTKLGSVNNNQIWDYLYYADCGLAFAEGKPQNFESSKIYYYLRAGLPVVCEEPVPNREIIQKAKLGIIVPYNSPEIMAKKIQKTVQAKWNLTRGKRYMIENHSWINRAKIYDKIFQKEFKNR